MRLIDGRQIAAAIRDETAAEVSRLRAPGAAPTLAVVVPTDDEATAWYVRSIRRAAAQVNADCQVENLGGGEPAEVLRRLDALSADPTVHGIICQTPLLEDLTLADVAAHIAPDKDVDGASVVSLGRLTAGFETFPPATAAAVVEILRRENVPMVGARTVVIGRSTVVGKPPRCSCWPSTPR